MKEFFYHYQRCASYSGTLNCPGLLLPGMRDTDPQFRDIPGHSGTVGHPIYTLPYWSNPPFLIVDIPVLCSGAQDGAPEHPNVKN